MMSAVRLLPLLAVSLVLCLSLPVLTVGVNPPDPTIGCFGIAGTGTTGIYQSDSGYYGMYGLQSYSSATYDILCAWRGLYYYGPHGQTNVYAPWHGNPKVINKQAAQLHLHSHHTSNETPMLTCSPAAATVCALSPLLLHC